MNFDQRTGTDPEELAKQIRPMPVPDWFPEAGFGVFIHLGLYSVPGWAVKHPAGAIPSGREYHWHQYAEWYANTLRLEGSPTRERHRELYGPGHRYEDFTSDFRPTVENLEKLVETAKNLGAKYLIPTAKHHDGYCLWDTQTTSYNAVRQGPGIGIIGALATATRKHGMRFGIYFSGALDWHVSDLPPIASDEDLFNLRRNDREFADYSYDQCAELIKRYRPDILWNDIDWPDAGKGSGQKSLDDLFGLLLQENPDATINDRWGIPVRGYLTREYNLAEVVPGQAWEYCRGLGKSFGYNRNESAQDMVSAGELAELYRRVRSRGGNLLLNLGPRADATLDEDQQRVVESLEYTKITRHPL